MNFGSDGGVSKRRKVFYDDYSGGFYTENRIEELKRKCDYRSNLTEVLNRSEDTRLSLAIKTVNTAKNLFELKREKELTFHRESLKDHLAYKQVLGNILRERENTTDWDDKYGRYGPGVTKKDLEESIQHQIYEMSPMVKRKRQAEMLLSHRKKVEVFDRKMATPDLLGLVHNKRDKEKPRSPSRKKSPKKPAVKDAAKLILPPITVTFKKDENSDGSTKRVSVHGVDVGSTPAEPKNVTPDIAPTPSDIQNSVDSGLPSIFVTHIDGDN